MKIFKYVVLALLAYVFYLFYQAEEHFQHLVEVIRDELDHEHYNEHSSTHPDHLAPNWMSDLDDNMSISNLTIPGSHNTGTFACPKICIINQCQGWNIKNQLLAGLRYLDFRVNDKAPLTIYHGPFVITQLQPMLTHVAEFLRENPTEFVFVSFQLEFGKKDPSRLVLAALQKAGIDTVFSKKILTVGELRGKAYIIAGVDVMIEEAYKIEGYFGIWDLPTAYIQNMFILFPWDVKYKKSIVEDTINVPCSPTRYNLNYWTGAFAVLPYMFAKIGKGPNSAYYEWLRENRGRKCIGITMMDFPSHKLIKELYMTNFQETDF